ncbi:MAG: RNA ligase [Gammaproteobacteria bacterium RIFOXYA12_FULL_61_12]|nr:MAG: RNA ligase [Gammaproteobacteria bacterium RIFOXYD12_FULL_61_37]OGT92483.1 MAG: RNA ligase [Gammaproteobacteria bacterium RIFOXYA12_FULL_61_12]
MSTFAVPIKRILATEPHPNADAIELAVIDGYRSVVKKDQFQQGDLVAYLPEASLLPEWLLKHLGFWDAEKNKGRLSGKAGNRVKAIRLRGELSQGICYSVVQDSASSGQIIAGPGGGAFANVAEGDDVAGILGIVKYEPPIPVSMAGEVFNVGTNLTLDFDVENWKSYPGILRDGEEVIFTEKLHGSFTGLAILPYADAHPEAFGEKKNILIFSKGLGAKGLVLKNNDRNRDNLYVRSTRDLIERIDEAQRDNPEGVLVPNFILGETFGLGVQDLAYGRKIGFRVFAAAYGYRGSQRYQSWSFVEGSLRERFGFETVPVLYRGPFSEAIMREYTDGRTSLDAGHIREGIVMVPVIERHDPAIGRVCLKSVSADYLMRNGGTEYN